MCLVCVAFVMECLFLSLLLFTSLYNRGNYDCIPGRFFKYKMKYTFFLTILFLSSAVMMPSMKLAFVCDNCRFGLCNKRRR